ncbi:unnamed protein product [Schistosoma margrebowiei]|uniref:Fork-head domain-containing protein n=1 Tax=Schistosoma margrebowiei TaxID=48269 RepID=A0AA85ALZ3_9TREM|nr:unnamed protein product [Schistosoma margrebowiei]
MSCNNTLPSNIFSNHHQFMLIYDDDDNDVNDNNNHDHTSNTNHNMTHPISNWFTSQTAQMISSRLPISTSTSSTSVIHNNVDNHSDSHSFSSQTDPFRLAFETSPIQTNTIHHYNANCNRHLHPGIQQYNSLFIPYHNYINQWKNVQTNNVTPPVDDNHNIVNVAKIKGLHRNNPQRRQHHRHHQYHHRHHRQQIQQQQQQQFQPHNVKSCDLITEDEPKPNFSYIGLIAKAILSTQERRMILSEIYQWIQLRYPYFSTRGPGWRNSIRHNLSLNDCFIKVGRAANGKGHYWGIHPANLKDFLSGDFRRRRAQRKVRRALGLSRPDDKIHDDDDDDDDDDDGDDVDGDDGGGGNGDRGDDQISPTLNSPLIPQTFLQFLHPYIPTYQLTTSPLTPNSSPILTSHKHTFNAKSHIPLHTSIPLTNTNTNTNLFTFDQLTDSTNNQYTNNPSNITTPLLFNPSPVPLMHNSHLLPHQSPMNASPTSRMNNSTESKQSIQTLNTTNQLCKSSCTNNTLIDLFYINLMHLLKNHHSFIQADMDGKRTCDKPVLLVPNSIASTNHTTTTTTITTNSTTTTTNSNNNNSHTTATTSTTHTTNTIIPLSIPISDHHRVDCQYVNSSCSSFDPVFLRSHPLSTQHPINVSFNVVNLIDHKLNHSDLDPDSDSTRNHDDDDDDDEGVVVVTDVNNDASISKMMKSQQYHVHTKLIIN